MILTYKRLTGGIGVPGWASIMVSIWFLGGLTIFCIGVIGIYLAKMFTETKDRPYTIVRAEYGSDTGDTGRDRRRTCAIACGDYYEGRLRDHGATPSAWTGNRSRRSGCGSSSSSGCGTTDPDASLIDYGCGYGALAAFVRGRGHRGPYTGFDISGNMADAAMSHTSGLADCRLDLTHRGDLGPADYAVASGIFNVKLDADDGEWRAYVRRTIADLASLATRGFAFNALTLYSDRRQAARRSVLRRSAGAVRPLQAPYSRFVTLLHDYPLYEFTLLVRAVTDMARLVIFGAGDIARLAHLLLHPRQPARRGRRSPSIASFRRATRFLGLPLVDAEEMTDALSRRPSFDMFVALSYAKMNGLRAEKYARCKAAGYRLAATSARAAPTCHRRRPATTASSSKTTPSSRSSRIGSNVTLWSGNHIGHDSTIEDHCFIASHVVVSGHVRVGAQSVHRRQRHPAQRDHHRRPRRSSAPAR